VEKVIDVARDVPVDRPVKRVCNLQYVECHLTSSSVRDRATCWPPLQLVRSWDAASDSCVIHGTGGGVRSGAAGWAGLPSRRWASHVSAWDQREWLACGFQTGPHHPALRGRARSRWPHPPHRLNQVGPVRGSAMQRRWRTSPPRRGARARDARAWRAHLDAGAAAPLRAMAAGAVWTARRRQHRRRGRSCRTHCHRTNTAESGPDRWQRLSRPAQVGAWMTGYPGWSGLAFGRTRSRSFSRAGTSGPRGPFGDLRVRASTPAWRTCSRCEFPQSWPTCAGGWRSRG
jgi:hypothetical protein